MFRNRSVDVHDFAMVPRAEIPRSAFNRQSAHKTTFDLGYLVPFYLDEVLPGDTHAVDVTMFVRTATPVFPMMDNLHLETFFFFVPNRLLWTHWVNFMGEQANPADSISYTIPISTSPAGGYAINSLQDYMGLGTVGQITGGATFTHGTLHIRAYNLIWNTWFRDENMQNSVTVDTGDGPDTTANYVLLRRGKRKDYFSGALPWPQKGNSPQLLITGTARVKGDGNASAFGNPRLTWGSGDRNITTSTAGVNVLGYSGANDAGAPTNTYFSAVDQGLYADLTTATANTINQLRSAFQIQKLLERDARGGTRYTEIVRSHFGVVSPDARLQRPEYLGGGSTPIAISPIAQTSGTSASGTTTPLGTLAAMGQGVASRHGFKQSFTEHGVILGLVHVRADLTYQQGMRKMWRRSTRYDFYFPVFAMLGEQAVFQEEIYQLGGTYSANDGVVFGYQEHWAEYRYMPSMITGVFRSTAAGTLDPWHMAQKFTSAPTLNSTFVQDTPPGTRVFAAGNSSVGQMILMDAFLNIRSVRPMPMYSVPGLIDHF